MRYLYELYTFAEISDSEQVVLKCGNDLAVAGGKGGQVEVGGCGGGMEAFQGVADVGCGGVQVDAVDGGSWSDVFVTGASVGNGCVGDGNARRGGRATARRGGAKEEKSVIYLYVGLNKCSERTHTVRRSRPSLFFAGNRTYCIVAGGGFNVSGPLVFAGKSCVVESDAPDLS